MDGLSFTFARIHGVPIRAHLSLLIIFFIFLAPALTAEPAELGRLSRTAAVGWSLVTVLAFFLTILLHELGHVYQARREKMEVHGVTLWALGGVASMSGGMPSPGSDFRVAAAGPAITALLAVGLNGLVFLALGDGGSAGPALAVVDRVGRAQVFLLVFNLIPAYPLDGGRMFLAALWRWRDNLTSARRTASAVGRGFGVLLMAIAVLGLLSRELFLLLPAALRIDTVAGLLIGYFIYSANRTPINPLGPVYADVAAERRRDGLIVADFMNREFVIAGPEMTIADLLKAFGRLQIRPIALIVKDGRPLGMVSRHAAEQVRETERETRAVADVMVAKDDIRSVNATDPLRVARQVLEDGPETAVVLNDDVVVGLVSISDVAHAMVMEDR